MRNNGFVQRKNLNVSKRNFKEQTDKNFPKTTINGDIQNRNKNITQNTNTYKVFEEFINQPLIQNDISQIKPKNNLKKNANIKNIAKYGLIATGIAFAILYAIKNKDSIQKIKSTIFNKNKPQTFEKPNFLYHLTSKDAYESIMRDGKIRTTDIDYPPGVFYQAWTI